jgi:hypothetical protein
MNLRKILGFQPKPYPYAHILHMWEDDNLMIELLPKENLEFIKSETKRIDEFGKNHFDGNGFTNITPIGGKPIKTIDKKIPIAEVTPIFYASGLPRIQAVIMQGVGLLKGDKAPVGFGTNRFAVIMEDKLGFLENIWITGHADNEENKLKLKNGIREFGKQFNFLGINWFKSEFYDLSDEKEIEKFIKNSC